MCQVITTREMKQFIIDTLGLEDLAPEGIGDEQTLFVEGLGLDSIDALELGIALRRKYHIQSAEHEPASKDDFRNVTSLLDFVVRHSQGALAVGA